MATRDQLRALYGKDAERERIKSILTSDNVLKPGEMYDSGTPRTTTKADDYKSWKEQAIRAVPLKQGTLESNINFGSYSGEKASIKKTDFGPKQFSKVSSYKPNNSINIVDLDPQYLVDKPKLTSSYAQEFDKDSLTKHQTDNKVVIHGTGNPITNYLRATHFTLGSDAATLKTEAQAAFSDADALKTADRNSVAAERAKKDKRSNHVFRIGDYNMTKEPENKTVFSLSYSGAGISSRQKGYDHVVNSRANMKLDDARFAISQKLYNFLREKFQNPRDPCQVNLQQAFALFDKKRTGFISYENLSSVLKRILPITEHNTVGEIIALFDANHDGKIDYLEFERFLNQKYPEVEKETSLYEDTYKPSLLEGTAPRPRSSDNAPVDGGYQIKTHFRFGEGQSQGESLYKSTFGGSRSTRKPEMAKPPPPSQMLPVEPEHMKTTSSTSRDTFTSDPQHLRKLASERANTIKSNKGHHETASFSIGNDVGADRGSVMKSMTASSYIPVKTQGRVERVRGFQSQWNHLTTEDALPDLTAGPMISEKTSAYASNVTAALGEFSSNKNLRLARVHDEKTSHLCFGNDSNRGDHSEKVAQFGKPRVNPDCKPAGITGGPIAQHNQIHHETGDALSDPSVKSLQDAIKQTILEKCYNHRDPLNINLQKAFKEFDKNNTGKITVTGLREACKRLQLPVDEATLRRYFLVLDKNKDGSIDYTEFADELGFHIQTVSNKGMTSVMQSDYSPLKERSLAPEVRTGADPVIQPSHYFHLNNTDVTPNSTTQNDFSHPISKLDFSAFQTVGSL